MSEIREVLERACCVYEEELRSSEEARAYLESRRVNEESIRKFRLGCAPDKRSFLERLSSGIDKKLLKEAGLVGELSYEEMGTGRKEDGTFYFHFFPHRIMIPVFNLSGEIVGFGGRALCEKGSCRIKYLDTCGRNGFNRGETLYGVDLALNAANASRELYIFEGYFDVIMAHQSGLGNSVAVLGTYLRREGFRNLRRIFSKGKIKLCYDSDEAGQQAAQKSILELEGCDVEIYTLREYKDPADLFKDRKNIGDYLVEV